MGQKTKISYNYVYEYFKQYECELLSSEYKNMKSKLLAKCKCGEEFEITFNDFKFKGIHHCKKCTNKLKSDSRKINYDYVKDFIKSKGCSLLSKNILTAHDKLLIRCGCGNTFTRSFNKFKSGQCKCLKCSNKTQWNYDKVKYYVNKNSECTLLTNWYKDENTKMKFLCECGNIFETDLVSFIHSNKRQCNECGSISRKEKNKLGISILKQRVKNISNCELLSNTYNDYDSHLEFKCECGKTFKTSYRCFKNGKQFCNDCSSNSKLETLTEKFLKNNSVQYIPQCTFNNLRGINNGLLRFDFKVILNDGEYILLELDGEQHEKPMGYKNGDEKLLITQEHDKRKNIYCKQNNIKLYRISYKSIDILEDILIEILHKHDNPVPSL